MAVIDEMAILNKNSDDFTEWEEAADHPIASEELEESLAGERALALESELEQDENPRDYNEELEEGTRTRPNQ